MNKLEIAKEIISKHIGDAPCGLFNSRNTAFDSMFTLYDKQGLQIDICYYWAYFEVFGLTDEEFKELCSFYEELNAARRDEDD